MATDREPKAKNVSVTIVRKLNAAPELVFAAWTEPRLIAKWLAPGLNNIAAVTTDLRAGGRYRIDGIDDTDKPYSVSGTYLEIVEHRRIAMSWEYEGSAAALRGAPSVVIAEMQGIEAELTMLTITHEQLGDRQAGELNRISWSLCVDKLEPVAETADAAATPPPRLNTVNEFYTENHRSFQDRFDTRRLADRVQSAFVQDKLNAIDASIIARQNMFFLATTDANGQPSCSYKGGDRGFVSVIDDYTVAFPCYDGSGMFHSMGNISDTGKVALLFVDFERQARLRVMGTASVSDNDSLMERYPGAQLIVRVAIKIVFANCPRYIPKMQLIENSNFIPKADSETAVPEWKRLASVADVLPKADEDVAGASTDAEKAMNRD